MVVSLKSMAVCICIALTNVPVSVEAFYASVPPSSSMRSTTASLQMTHVNEEGTSMEQSRRTMLKKASVSLLLPLFAPQLASAASDCMATCMRGCWSLQPNVSDVRNLQYRRILSFAFY